MKPAAWLLVLAAIACSGCGGAREKARDVAVTTFRVIDAPARYVRNRIDESENRTTTTTTTEYGSSDVVTPGRPIPPGPRNQQPTVTQRGTTSTGAPPTATPRPTARPQTAAATATPRSTTSPTGPAPTEFPTAKAVPDKPGFVFSPYDGAYVDVTGFKSGDKARDPKSKQIFIVP